MPAPITIKLRCASWKQLAAIYKRDLGRNAIFLKSSSPPPLGTAMRVNLTLPSETLIVLSGRVREHVPLGGLDGRGPGIDIELDAIPQSAMWLIESALASLASKSARVARMRHPARARAVRAKTAPPAVPPASPSMEAGAELVEAEDELVAAMKQELESLSKLNPFQVLGIGYETTDAAVRAAFGELTKRYHPDRFARYQSNEARHYASEIFILIRNAYRDLVDSSSRARTLKDLRNRRALSSRSCPVPPARPPTQPPPPPQQPPARARPTIPQAPTPPLSSDLPEVRRRAGTVPPAAEVRSTGDAADAADRLLDAGKYVEALALLRLAAKRNPGDNKIRAGIELAAGLRAMAERDRLEAAQRFEAVLELDPTNERAARELAEMRRQATNERRGLMARLLGKKN